MSNRNERGDEGYEECFICGKPVLNEKLIPSITAVETIKVCSIKKDEGSIVYSHKTAG